MSCPSKINNYKSPLNVLYVSVHFILQVMQFSAYKTRKDGGTIDLEITAMVFDPTYRRLITAAKEGPVKVNLNE